MTPPHVEHAARIATDSAETEEAAAPSRAATPHHAPLVATTPADDGSGEPAGSVEQQPDENAIDHLRRSTTPAVLSLELVAGYAGDRSLSATERETIERQRRARGSLLFSDLLYSLSHHHFPVAVAEPLWGAILEHEHAISARLGRNPGVAVAALDYLSNLDAGPIPFTLISEIEYARLASLAMRDGMTGLFNHSACYEILDLELRNHRRHGVGVCVLLLDIDDFKSFNERGGLQAGDEVIVELAKMLVEEARDSDVCCRLGGDEFVIVLRLADDPSAASKLAERIHARSGRMTSHGQELAVTIGVAACDESTPTASALIDKADRALRRAKAAGKNRVAVG